jgi:TRAP-type C4-dicarboxylate transport system permease small subunit
MKLLRAIDGWLNKIEAGILIAFLSIMLVLAFFQVVLRNVFSSGILWGDILLRHLLLWIGFLGAAIATSEERHINIEALKRFFPKRIHSAVEALTDLFAAAICALLMNASMTFVKDEMTGHNMIFGNIPSWYAQVIIPVGFGLLAVHFVIRALLRAQKAIVQEEAP